MLDVGLAIEGVGLQQDTTHAQHRTLKTHSRFSSWGTAVCLKKRTVWFHMFGDPVNVKLKQRIVLSGI